MNKKRGCAILCIFLLISIVSISANAESTWYVIDEANMSGPSRTLTAEDKEYTSVSVNTNNKESVTVLLYAVSMHGPQWFGNDQELDYGYGRRAWWYGDKTQNRDYYIATSTTASSMNLSGYFQNYMY
jgi:hypothetical protein